MDFSCHYVCNCSLDELIDKVIVNSCHVKEHVEEKNYKLNPQIKLLFLVFFNFVDLF